MNLLNPPPPARGLTLKSLNDLTTNVRANLINRYFRSLLRDPQPGSTGKLLLDKNSSATSSLYIWLRLFPRSKIVMALGDPRDIVINCYFQNCR